MSKSDDRVFMVARAMARHDGHTPDDTVMDAQPYLIRGRQCSLPGTALIPIWQFYTGLATVAIEKIDALAALEK
jgi:hypothetical protein